MFKTKVKNFLILFSIIFSASFLFVGCKNDNVKAERLNFVNTDEIVLIVGDKYTPQVEVLPSYASNKDYYLEVGVDSGVLKIEEKTIIATKEGTVQLKAISADNENINDAITVKVVASPETLSAPQNLTFNGERFNFNAVSMATGYILNINGQEIRLASLTSLSFKDCLKYVDDLYDKTLTVKVKAYGDGHITLDSDYSTEIKVKKLKSPSYYSIDNSVLTISKVEGVEEYKFTVCNFNGQVIKTISLRSEDFNENVIKYNLSVDIADLAGGVYKCILVDEKNAEASDNAEVFKFDPVELNLTIVGKPLNLNLYHYNLTWDSVVGAESYTLFDESGNVIETNILTNSFNLESFLKNNKKESYALKVLAISSNKTNCISGIKFSEVINFSVLENPSNVDIDLENNLIKWDNIENSVGYRLSLENLDSGSSISYTISNIREFDVSSLDAGSYKLIIKTCGDGKNYLDALETKEVEFSILPSVQGLKINNKVFSWNEQEGETYTVAISSVDGLIQEINTNSYDISNINLEAGSYEFSVFVKAHSNKFASKKVVLPFFKLNDASNISLNSASKTGILSFNADSKISSTVVSLYKKGDKTNIISLKEINVCNYSFDTSLLEVGEYCVEVQCLGNGKDVLDADNLQTEPYTIIKLGAPTINIDKINFNISVDIVSTVNGYELYENGKLVKTLTATDNNYSISALTPNEYRYQVKNLGNGENIVSSNLSDDIKVIKLTAPTISFDKATKTFSLSTSEEKYVANYVFKLDNKEMEVVDKKINCEDELNKKDAGEYEATAYLEAISEDPNGYAKFIINSFSESLTITKIDSSANLNITNGVLTIKPNNISDLDSSYRAKLNIGYRVSSSDEYSYMDFENLVFDGEKYSVKIYDENFDAVGPLVGSNELLFGKYNDFTISLEIDNVSNLKICSNVTNLGNITRRDEVVSVKKSSENITFDAVLNANAYKLFITTDKTYYIGTNSTTLSIDELREKFAEVGLTIKENVSYTLGIVAMGDDASRVLPSKVKDIFTFKVLKTPTATLNENGIKAVKVLNNVDGATRYGLKFEDEAGNIFTTYLTNDGSEYFSYMLNNVNAGNLNSGNISVTIIAENTTGENYFKSASKVLNYVRLEAPQISLTNGVVSWDDIKNVSSYILWYYKDGQFETKVLTNGTENFAISNGKAYYDLLDIEAGVSRIRVQAISICFNSELDMYYYDSKESDIIEVQKLNCVTARTEKGDMLVLLETGELDLIDRVEIIRLSDERVFDLSTLVDSISSSNVITAEKILKYLSQDAILAEEFTFKVYAKEYGDVNKYVLNSNTTTESFYGLKTVSDLSIDTTFRTDGNETIDTLTWTNNTLNSSHTGGYTIVITYNEKDYTYPIKDENSCKLIFPKEEEFGAGEYKIKIMANAKDNEYYLNSLYSEEFSFKVCEVPNNIRTENGIIYWDNVVGAKNYRIRIYDSSNNIIESISLSKNSLDFNTLSASYLEGLYKVSVQAINEIDSRIVSSEISPQYLFVKLPKISKYKIIMGELYVYAHSFTEKIAIVLTNKDNVSLKYDDLVLENSSTISEFKKDENINSWEDVENLDNLLSTSSTSQTHKMGYIKFALESNDGTMSSIINCINAGYYLDITAIGSTGDSFMTLNSSISRSAVDTLVNENDEESKTLIKTQTPTINVSKTTRGRIEWKLLDTTYTDMDYFGLTNHLIYNVNMIVSGENYNFYVFDNFDIRNIGENATLVVYSYPLLTSKPNDWEEKYNSYFEYVAGEGFKNISGGVAPSFEENKYYRYNKDVKNDFYGYLIYKDMVINIISYTDGINSQNDLFIDFSKETLTFAYPLKLEGQSVATQTLSLTEGGKFYVSVSVLGDCTSYLTSNMSETLKIVRYKELTLSVVDGNLAFDNLATLDDSPIYLLTVKQNGNVVALIYLYDVDEGSEFKIPQTIDGKTYVCGVRFKDENNEFLNQIHYMLDMIVDGEDIIKAGNYQISLITYYRDSSSFEMIESKSSGETQITKLAKVSTVAENKGYLIDGRLSWKQLFVNSGALAIENYEIVVNGRIKFRIGKDDYQVRDGNIYYTIPEKVFDLNSNTEYEFDLSESYSFEISSLAGDNKSYINSNPTDKIEAQFTGSVRNVQKTQNAITWESDYTEGLYEYVLSYNISADKVVTYTNTTDQKSFVLPTSIYDDSSQMRYLTSNYSYRFKVKRVGNNALISSFYVEMEGEMERIKTISESSIRTNNGVLNWESPTSLSGNEISNIVYKLTVKYENGDLKTFDVDKTEFSFEELRAGEMTITLSSECEGYFNSFVSSEVTIWKFDSVKDIILSDYNNIFSILSWDAVKINDEYADIYCLDIAGKVATIAVEEKTDTISVNIAEIDIFKNMNLTGEDLKCKVQARSGKTNSYYINSEWSDEKSFGKVSSIDADKFVLNGLYFEWNQIQDENPNSDSYVLEFKLKKLSASGYEDPTTIQIIFNANDSKNYVEREIDGVNTKVYRFKPSIIGIYENIRVTVNRTSAIASDEVIMTSGNNNVSYDFNLYAYGEGVEGNPYVITNINHFKNISSYNTSYFEIASSLELGNTEFSDGHLVTGEFKGVLDGGNHSIYQFILSSTKNTLGIFESLNGAEIKNLNISNLKVVFNKSYDGEDMYVGILASKATGATINNVNISIATMLVSIEDDFTKQVTLNREMYIGGMIGYMQQTQAKDCNVDLTGYKVSEEDKSDVVNQIDVRGCGKDNVYFGGFAGSMVNSSISGTLNEENYSSSVKLKFIPTILRENSTITYYPNLIIGGVVGEMTSGSEVSHVLVAVSQMTNPNNTDVLIFANGGVAGIVGDEKSTADENLKCKIEYVKVTNCEENIGIGGGVSTVEDKFSAIYLGKLVAIKRKNVILSNNIEEISLEHGVNDKIIITQTDEEG